MALNQELHRMRRDILVVSTAALGELTGVSRNRLSLYFSGTSQLHNTEIVRLEETFKDLEAIVTAADPFPVSFQDVSRIKDLIQRVKGGEFAGRRQP
jgi:hypothetical protein